jgi:hypothetical protein
MLSSQCRAEPHAHQDRQLLGVRRPGGALVRGGLAPIRHKQAGSVRPSQLPNRRTSLAAQSSSASLLLIGRRIPKRRQPGSPARQPRWGGRVGALQGEAPSFLLPAPASYSCFLPSASCLVLSAFCLLLFTVCCLLFTIPPCPPNARAPCRQQPAKSVAKPTSFTSAPAPPPPKEKSWTSRTNSTPTPPPPASSSALKPA